MHGSAPPIPKLAITVDAEVAEGIVAAAAREGKSVSAWITEATRERLAIEDGLRAVAEWEAEHGAFTEDELAAADAWIEAATAPVPATGTRRKKK